MEDQQHQFTDKELEVILLLLEGKSTQEIALRLSVSTRAVEHRLTHIFQELSVGSRTEAVLKLTYLFKK
ncbi:MAG: LuxR C-terminal-related transcriptional regulator [Anaerolineaceae bacterium]|jgi:DNA-binding NarL/FixJ family response regulator|nr:LuxR C-terminal-related transcriptional regulator [Anaerolineaceae bacterium]OQY87401.1 MAG: hypothetical protein B6D38_12615 [Anaerolineae bacterium UTCFX1]